ncbi:MAG: tautomerase family protein [Muricomes sp.]
MPHISIKLYPGRTEEVKQELALKTQKFLSETMNLDPNVFSVAIEEIEKENWDKEVVQNIKEDTLYVKPNF